MKVLIVSHEEVRQHLSMADCMTAMENALKLLGSGDALNPLRNVVWLPDRSGLMAMMPAGLSEPAVMGLKAISVFPGNSVTAYDSHQGAIMLFETRNGRLLALIDATEVTAIRTAAVSGVATRLLAREDAGDLAILGAGTQARKHLEAMLEARAVRRVRVWSRNRESAEAFAKSASARYRLTVETMASGREAVSGADIICTTTSSAEPILEGDWVAPGAHINAVGACTPSARELDSAAVVKSKLYVDRRESTINEAGDFMIPQKEGLLSAGHILGEIGELLLGKAKGRSSAEDITLFKSLGLAVEDVAAAHLIYSKASASGTGTRVELNAGRNE